jgi:transcriptional regulator with XRE-family HTH domain
MLANNNLFSLSNSPLATLIEMAKKVRALRKQMGYSQAELASRSGVSLGSIKRFERTGQISLEALLKVANLLDRLNDFDTIFESKEVDKEIKNLFSH